MSAARIGKIRLKAGGAEVRVLDRSAANPNGENWRGKIIENARTIASYDEPGSTLVGYFIVGFYSDGAASSGFRWDASKSPIPRRLMPSYVAELVREDALSSQS